jgi:hypothetical protein
LGIVWWKNPPKSRDIVPLRNTGILKKTTTDFDPVSAGPYLIRLTCLHCKLDDKQIMHGSKFLASVGT